MFSDYLRHDPWANRSHRGWTALVSFAAQALAVAALLALPLFYTQALPRLSLLGSVIAPAPPPAPGVAGAAHTRAVTSVAGHLLLPPRYMPTLSASNGPDVPYAELPAGPGVLGVIGDQPGAGTVLDAIGTGISPRIPIAPSIRPPRVSHVMEGNLVHRVQPDYPALAKQARIQGIVVLRAVIDREGVIQNLQVISGHPLLVQAALNAVRQWRYRPFYLNDQPVEVETQVTVNFSLSGG